MTREEILIYRLKVEKEINALVDKFVDDTGLEVEPTVMMCQEREAPFRYRAAFHLNALKRY